MHCHRNSNNDPLNRLDPFGLCDNPACGGGSTAAAGASGRAENADTIFAIIGGPVAAARAVVGAIVQQYLAEPAPSPTGGAAAGPAPDPNKLNHIFGNPGHNLDPVVQQFGSQTGAYGAIEQAVANKLGSGTGTYTTVVNVGGSNVTVSGAYVNGIPRVGTAYIP